MRESNLNTSLYTDRFELNKIITEYIHHLNLVLHSYNNMESRRMECNS